MCLADPVAQNWNTDYNDYMFTLEQIDEVHKHLGKATTLYAYLHALRDIGVAHYSSYLVDGHSEYFADDGQKIVSPPVHNTFAVSQKSDKQAFLEQLALHQKGETDYFQMSQGLAKSGIEKWTFDTHEMTITYYDLAGNSCHREKIQPK